MGEDDMGLALQGELRPIENAYSRLLEALDSQVRLLFELESKRDDQRAAIESDEPESMLALLDARQKLIDSLTALDRDIAVLRSQVESQGSRITPAQRDEITRRAGSVAQAIQRVLAADAQDGDAMERRRTAIASEIEGVADSRKAAAAYGHSGAGGASTINNPGAMFQDRRA
jgi:flagellar biosynthesis/type III secretory pathway chaperone